MDKPTKESNLSKALSKAANHSHASNYSSGSSSANVTSRTGGVTASVDTDTELAWEAGFRAGQEAMAMVAAGAAEDEWQQMMSRRMANLARMQSSYMLGEADDGMWGDEDYPWGMEQGLAHNAGQNSKEQARTASVVVPERLLGEFPVHMDGAQAAPPDVVYPGAPALNQLEARLVPPGSPIQQPSRSRPISGRQSPGLQHGSPSRRTPVQPHHQLSHVQQQSHQPRLEQLPEELEEQASVHMADVPSAEFENMFESKYSPVMAEGSSICAAYEAGARVYPDVQVDTGRGKRPNI